MKNVFIRGILPSVCVVSFACASMFNARNNVVNDNKEQHYLVHEKNKK